MRFVLLLGPSAPLVFLVLLQDRFAIATRSTLSKSLRISFSACCVIEMATQVAPYRIRVPKPPIWRLPVPAPDLKAPEIAEIAHRTFLESTAPLNRENRPIDPPKPA
ncbi:hypothetical protein [Thiocystis violacea]|uniref:hypothetical protein n=1 Tax=Thiocystis violacea TaxID=13725 RepID=UPI001A928BA7|nr:hypothetical protein [Thiocystis violacea]